MSLISLLIAIMLERLLGIKKRLHYPVFFQAYRQLMGSYIQLDSSAHVRRNVIIWLMLPVFTIFAVQYVLGTSLFGLLFNCLVLLACLGCPENRALYKRYLEAGSREDTQACYEYAMLLGQKRNEHFLPLESFGQSLVWLNFKHYIAVIIWFILLGPAGCALYVFTLALKQEAKTTDNELPFVDNVCEVILHILDFLPARIATFAYMFVGNFTSAAQYWFKHLLDFDIASRRYVTKIALAAEDFDCPDGDCLTEPQILLKLAKRAVVFVISLIALLTIIGVIG